MTNKFDELVKSRKTFTNVMPAKAGIQRYQMVTRSLDPGFRRGDDFLRVRQNRLVMINCPLMKRDPG
jgi:hypothetical protein